MSIGRPSPDLPGRAFLPSGFFVLRTPLLPFATFADWSGGPDGDGERRVRLRGLLDRPELREAVFLASASVAEAVEAWRKDPDGARGRRLEPVLVAYLARACGRPTPFGLFGGVTPGLIGDRTNLALHGRDRYRRRARLSPTYLASLARTIAGDSRYATDLVFRPNNSLNLLAGRLRYAEAAATDAGPRYRLVAVDRSPHLMATLERARAGVTGRDLAEALVGGPVNARAARAFIAQLVEGQILVPDIAPAVTGESPGPGLRAALAGGAATMGLAAGLQDAQAGVEALEGLPVGVEPDRYREVAAALDRMPVRPDPAGLVEVDLHKPGADVTLGERVADEIARGVTLLWRIQPPAWDGGLATFRDDFERRYGTRSVPLVEALDEEHGIGFEASRAPGAGASPLLAGLPFPRPAGAGDEGMEWTERDAVLLEKLAAALDEGAGEIHLTPADVDGLAAPDPDPLPDAFHVLASLAAVSDDAADRGEFRVLVDHARGPSGARLLGRFTHADPVLRDLVDAHLRAEESLRPGVVYAEIVHEPAGAAAVFRPVLRDYEIPFLGRSGAPPDRQIPVADLRVTLDGQRVVLHSVRLGREVVPRLTSAHNATDRSVRMYRFLAALGQQGVASHLAWDWGALAGAPFLPRVSSGRVVLARARWNLSRDERDWLGRNGVDAAALQAWRRRRRVPRWVMLADEDRQLVVDLDSGLSRAAMARQLRRPSAPGVLVELFPGPEALVVAGPEGRFTSEMVVPFVRRPDGPPPGPAPGAVALPAPDGAAPRPGGRRFPPGSEWFYAKLYVGEATADAVLTGTIAPLARSLVEGGAADRWFFVREADPDPHLRIRFQGRPDRLRAEVFPALTAATSTLVDDGRVWRIAIDTYEREVERYGGPQGVELAERVFAADSEAVVALLAGPGWTVHPDLRWRLALCGMDQLFADFGFDLPEKQALVQMARDAYADEFGADREFRAGVGRRFRRERRALSELLVGGVPEFRRRSERIAPATAELRELAGRNRLSVALPEIARSLAHMHVGRMLRSELRAGEYVLYEFLDRLYRADSAR